MIRTEIKLTKRQEAVFRAHAEEQGYKITGYIRRLIVDEIERIVKEETLDESHDQLPGD